MIVRVLICGDREWKDSLAMRHIIRACESQYGNDIAVIHGAARGADYYAGLIATNEELTVWSEPAKWSVHGNRAGPIRNQLMLDRYKPNLVIACHPNIDESKGTKHMVQIAKSAGVPVIHIRNLEDAENIKNALSHTVLCSKSSQ